MYGSSLYNKELFCEFDFESGFYGEPEAHIISIGASSLAVPGVEAPSNTHGALISGAVSETPYTNIIFEDPDVWTAVVVGVATGETAVPGVEAPSTITGMLMQGPLLAAMLSPHPPLYMYSETFVTGSPTPYLYETGLYDDNILENPYTTYTVNSYNTGMAIATCLIGGHIQQNPGGFVFDGDMVGGFGATHNMHSAAVAMMAMDSVEVLISHALDIEPAFFWPGDVAKTLHKSQDMPRIPQLIREATELARLITPELDTTTLIPMSFMGTELRVLTFPDGPVIVPAHMATGLNGVLYRDTKRSDTIIYGSRYNYISRGAQYLGLSGWDALYIDGNKVAGVLPGLSVATLTCGGSQIEDIYVDYLFGLHNLAAAMSFHAPAMDPSAGETLPVLQYGYEVYLGRSAIYNAIQRALGPDTTATVALAVPWFDNSFSATYFTGALADVLHTVDMFPAPLLVDTAATISLQVSGHLCDRSDPAVQFADEVGVWSAYALARSAPTIVDTAAALSVSEGMHVLDDPFVVMAHMADGLESQNDAVLYIHFETCEVIELLEGAATADSSAAEPGALLFVEEAGDTFTHELDDSTDAVNMTLADFSSPHSTELHGVLARVLSSYAVDGATRQENYLALAGVLEAVFECRDASPEHGGMLFTEYPAVDARDIGEQGLAGALHNLAVLLSDGWDYSYMYTSGEHIELRVTHVQGSEAVHADDTYSATVALASFGCVHHSRTHTADVIEYVIEASDTHMIIRFEPDVHLVDVVFARGDVDRQDADFGGVLLELGHVPACFGGSFAATIAYGVSGCAYSASEFDGNALAECVYVNLVPTPYWYDFVIEYDFAETDPTDMAFIF